MAQGDPLAMPLYTLAALPITKLLKREPMSLNVDARMIHLHKVPLKKRLKKP